MGLRLLDPSAWFKTTFEKYYEDVRRFIYYKCGDSSLAEDIAQETFVKLWDMRASVRMDSVHSLLYAISSNLLKNHLKHKSVVLKFELAQNGTDYKTDEADYGIRQQQLKDKIDVILSEMPEKCRIPFLMNRIDELSYTEIADRLELSVKAVEKRMKEAIAFVRNRLEYKI